MRNQKETKDLEESVPDFEKQDSEDPKVSNSSRFCKDVDLVADFGPGLK